MEPVKVPARLVLTWVEGYRAAFQEAARKANEAIRQRDFWRERALAAECALREATGECPDYIEDPCPKVFGLRCKACGGDMEKEARYL